MGRIFRALRGRVRDRGERASLERDRMTSDHNVPVGNVDAEAAMISHSMFPPGYVKSYDEGRPRK
jgi:hypothetical protein